MNFRDLDKINWNVRDEQGVHAYPAKFPLQLPRTFIELLTKKDDVVLDPFCGCGTTLIAAKMLGRNAKGIDANPLAALISKVRTTHTNDKEITKINDMLKTIGHVTKHEKEFKPPKLPDRKLSKMFTKELLQELQIIKNSINIMDGNARDIALAALSATIQQIISGKKDVFALFKHNVFELMEEIKKIDNKNAASVATGDSRCLQIDDRSIDLIITSPPYANVMDYHRTHMYNMFMLDMDYKEFRRSEIGCHSHHFYNRFRLLSEYLGDMLRSLIEMNRVLKHDKFCVLVVGNSTICNERIENHAFLTRMAQQAGFESRKIITRQTDKSRKYDSNIYDEFIVVLQKTSNAKHGCKDDKFVASIVKSEMQLFREHVNEKNLNKIDEALKNVEKDIRIRR